MKLVLKKISHRARCWLAKARVSSLLTVLVITCAGAISPSALSQTEPFVVADIRVEGLQRIAPGSVFAALPVPLHEMYRERACNKLY